MADAHYFLEQPFCGRPDPELLVSKAPRKEVGQGHNPDLQIGRFSCGFSDPVFPSLPAGEFGSYQGKTERQQLRPLAGADGPEGISRL